MGFVVKRQGDRVEHVLPVPLFPLAVLSEVDTESRESLRHDSCDLVLARPAIADQVLADLLRRVHDDRLPAPVCHPMHVLGESVHASETLPRMLDCPLDDERSWVVETHPVPNQPFCLQDPLILGQETQRSDAARDEFRAIEDCVPELAKSGVKGEDWMMVRHSV